MADGLEPDRELLASIQQEVRDIELYLERIPAPASGPIWPISSGTVSLIPMLRAQAGGHAIERDLPTWMLQPGAFDTRIWQWLALVLLTLAALPIGHLLARALIRALQPIVRRTQSQLDDTLVESIRAPMQLLIALTAYRIGIVWVAPPTCCERTWAEYSRA